MRPFLMLALLLAAAGAHATDYVAQPGSKLGFTATYMDEAFEGSFAKFTPVLRFDPAQLDTSRMDVRITLASASTANAERDEMLVGSEFFDAGAAPEARYVATGFRALGGNRFVAEGTLSRLAFKVGTGDWTDTELLPDKVKVSTRLVLSPKAP